jgi:hypothetical protein
VAVNDIHVESLYQGGDLAKESYIEGMPLRNHDRLDARKNELIV